MRFLIVFVFIGICSCYIPGNVINDYTQCYNGQTNDIDKLCRIDGYYLGKFSTSLNDPGGSNIMLFKDGTCVINIIGYIEKDSMHGKDLYKMSTAPSWGTYILKNDTIISQLICYSSIHQSNINEYTYKINNDSTIWKISGKRLRDGITWINDSSKNFYTLPMKFIKVENKPDSACWLKEKEWFWCDEKKFEAYMTRLKEDKKKKTK